MLGDESAAGSGSRKARPKVEHSMRYVSSIVSTRRQRRNRVKERYVVLRWVPHRFDKLEEIA